MKRNVIINQNQPFAVAVRIGELMKTEGTEAAKEKKALMKLLVELECGDARLIVSK